MLDIGIYKRMKNNEMEYQNSKIYKITSHLGDKIYIGSTTRRLCNRMASHRNAYKDWKADKRTKTTSFDLFDEYGVENCSIVLIEAFPCSSKDEKNAREAHYIKALDCVNKKIPNRTQAEYYKDNKEAIQQRQQRIVNCECGMSYSSSNRARHYIRRHPTEKN